MSTLPEPGLKARFRLGLAVFAASIGDCWHAVLADGTMLIEVTEVLLRERYRLLPVTYDDACPSAQSGVRLGAGSPG
jgi:hypothetical protein